MCLRVSSWRREEQIKTNKQKQNDEDNPASEGRPKEFPQGLGYLPEERRKRERGRERGEIGRERRERKRERMG